jgi:hypothetical protein
LFKALPVNPQETKTMSPVPAGWEQAHTDKLINQTVPLFGATDAQYKKMDPGYCRDKIDAGSMWLWRKTGIVWTDVGQVTTKGVAIAFWRWRPRKASGAPKEQRICLCLFLGSNATAVLADLETAIRAFADDQVARGRFYVVKEDGVTYPKPIEDVFSAESYRLGAEVDFPAEYGWPARKTWPVLDWS